MFPFLSLKLPESGIDALWPHFGSPRAGDGATLKEIVAPNPDYNPVYNYAGLNIDRAAQRIFYSVNTQNFQNENLRNRIISMDYEGYNQVTLFDQDWDSILGLVVDTRPHGLMCVMAASVIACFEVSQYHFHYAFRVVDMTGTSSFPSLLHAS